MENKAEEHAFLVEDVGFGRAAISKSPLEKLGV